MATSQKEWVLLALRNTPLDRIHLMKALFLLWIRADRDIPGYFVFEPYLYGPFSLAIYSVLAEAQEEGLLVQPPRPIQEWALYYLTNKGAKVAECAAQSADPRLLALLDAVTSEVATLKFFDLLGKVYQEAPEFAVKSIVRDFVRP